MSDYKPRTPWAYIVGIQARMSSTRLPGKVMMDLGGVPMIRRVWDACSDYWDRIVLTSKDPSDDVLCEYLDKQGMDFVRGSLDDVLSRYVEIADHFRPRCLVRVCGDAPFIQEGWIRKAMKMSPCFVPDVLHAGPWPEWRAADQRAAKEDREHAGHGYFKRFQHIFLAQPGYLMVNTQADMDEARRRLEKKEHAIEPKDRSGPGRSAVVQGCLPSRRRVRKKAGIVRRSAIRGRR